MSRKLKYIKDDSHIMSLIQAVRRTVPQDVCEEESAYSYDRFVLLNFTKGMVELKRQRYLMKGSHTKAEWEQKKKDYNNKCVYCGSSTRKLTKDHLIPYLLGGNDYIDNIVPACMGWWS